MRRFRLLLLLLMGAGAGVLSAQERLNPGEVPGVRGWWSAEDFVQAEDGAEVRVWENRVTAEAGGGTDLRQAAGTNPPPVLTTVAFQRGVKFRKGQAAGAVELLEAAALLREGFSEATVMVVYQGGERKPVSTPRVCGFGSTARHPDRVNDARHWNLGIDNNGSARFDGAAVTGYGPGLSLEAVNLRCAVFQDGRVSEWAGTAGPGFEARALVREAKPRGAAPGALDGSFYVGDVQKDQGGGGGADTTFIVFEVLVFDRVLTEAERAALFAQLNHRWIWK
jgi:hypothetical protein